MVFSDLALGAALIQRKTLSQVDKRHGVLGRRSAAASSSRCSACCSPARSPRCTASRTRSRCWSVLSLWFFVAALGATAAEPDAARDGLPARRGAADDRHARRRRSPASSLAALRAAAPGRSSSSRSWPRWSRPSLRVAALRVAPALALLVRRACATSAASAPTCSASGSAIPADQRRPLPDRPLPRHRRARHLRGRLQHDARPASKLGGPLQRVFSPAFSRIQDEPERIAATWARVARLIAAVSVPALGGLVVVAPDFVPLVLGGQWDAAVPVVQVLAWVGIIQALQVINMDILLARGRARTMFRFALVVTTAHLIAFAVGLQWGVIGVATAYAISTHAGRTRPDRACRAGPERVADGVRASHRGCVPGCRGHVHRRSGVAQLPRRCRCRRRGPARALHHGRCPRLRPVVPVACPRAGGRGPRAARPPRSRRRSAGRSTC